MTKMPRPKDKFAALTAEQVQEHITRPKSELRDDPVFAEMHRIAYGYLQIMANQPHARGVRWLYKQTRRRGLSPIEIAALRWLFVHNETPLQDMPEEVQRVIRQ